MTTIEIPVLFTIAFFVAFGYTIYKSGYYDGLDTGFRKALTLMEEEELKIIAQRIQDGVNDG